MERRDVLKGMGLSLGYAIATPTLLSLLHSCTSDSSVKWTPKFLSSNEGVVLENLVDPILPRTANSPGAVDVNVPQFIDLYYGKRMDNEDQAQFKEGLQAIMNELQIADDGIMALDVKVEEYEKLLAKYLRKGKEQQKKMREEGDLVFGALIDLRNTSVWAYRTSKTIGEEVLAYDPIPGAQLGCMSMDEATGGKRWSL